MNLTAHTRSDIKMNTTAFVPAALRGSFAGKPCTATNFQHHLPVQSRSPGSERVHWVCTSTTPRYGPVKPPKMPEKKQIPLYDVHVFLSVLTQAIQNTLRSLFKVADDWEATEKLGKEPTYGYDDYPEGKDGSLPRMVKGLPKREGFSPQMVGMLAKRGFEYASAQMPFIARLNNGSLDHRHKNSMWNDLPMKDIFRSVFDCKDFFCKPQYLTDRHWCSVEDDIFTSQFINGCHPVMLEHVRNNQQLKRIPDEFKLYRSDDGYTIQQLYEQNRLFIADYEILSRKGIADSPKPDGTGAYTRTFKGDVEMKKYFYAPFVVLYTDKNNKLQLLGIMLQRNGPGKLDIYSKTTRTSKPITYMFAKMHVACSDNQIHQFGSHLAGHLIWEPFCVAHQNVFVVDREDLCNKNKDHVVGKLLSEHFEGTIAINWLARQTLIASREDVQPLTDAPFAVGAQGAAALLKHMYSDWNFQTSSFPEMLKARGFDLDGQADGLRDFYYRDDGMKMWKALENYVQNVVEGDYGCGMQGDQAVSRDPVLKAWCQEVRENANIRTFPEKFESKKELTKALTTIIFHVSAQHAALNFPQWEYLSYVPNRPNSLFKPVASLDDPEDMKRDDIFQIWNLKGAAQPLTFMQFQVQFAYLLSTPPAKTLMNMNSPFPCEYAELKKDLQKIHDHIESDTRRQSGVDYKFLDPYNVPPSINI